MNLCMKCVDCHCYFSDQPMRGESENQMCSSLSSLLCTVFSSLPPSSVLFSFTVLVLSTVLFFKLTKRKPAAFEENSLVKDDDEVIRSTTQKTVQEGEEIFPEPELENEVLAPEKVIELGVGQINDYLLPKLSDLSSETESGDISFSSEDSDRDWSFRNNVGQFPMFSDDSISDDDSLIEIELPGGHYIGAKEEQDIEIELQSNNYIGSKEEQQEQPKFKFQKNLHELFQEQIFGQEDLMELLRDINEMNEEENLIEIDISMGSIKCSRLGIAA